MTRILLVRHGRPAAVDAARIPGHDLGRWVHGYDAAGIAEESAPPAALRALASSAACVVSSDLRRARESASWLAVTTEVQIEPELREAALPDSIASPLRLRPRTWTAVARLLWWLDSCGSRERIGAARERAARAADRLGALAVEHGFVVAVGHGIFNRMIAGRLRQRGWRGPGSLFRSHWEFAQFLRDNP